MNFFTTARRCAKNRYAAVAAGILLLSASSQACDSDEMIAQMRTACSEMVAGYQKAAGKSLAAATAQAQVAKARAHCQALEFDKAGMTLASASRAVVSAK